MYCCLWVWLLTFQVVPMDVPQPTATWQVPFIPSMALIKADGASLLFDDQGENGYAYDATGQLTENFTMTPAVNAIYAAPHDSVLVHLGENLLAQLSNSGALLWQMELPAPSVPPQIFGDYLIYTTGQNVLLLDPRDGNARFSLLHKEKVVSLDIVGGWIWISDATGTTVAWEPFSEKKETRLSQQPYSMRHVVRSPLNALTLLADDGRLEVKRADEKNMWRRNFHIDVVVPPIYLKGEKHHQILIATKGRNFFSFGATKGEQLARRLIKGRPLSMVAMGSSSALLITDQIPELLWYNALTLKFLSQKIDAKIDVSADCASFLLLVAENGIIRLYQK